MNPSVTSGYDYCSEMRVRIVPMTEPSPKNDPTWTSRRLLLWTTEYFKKKGIDNPRLSAEMLLAHVFSTQRIKLYMDPHRPTSKLERSTFRQLVERAAEHEPVDYLIGKCPFFSMTLAVNRNVMIPRPSTETVVEHIIQHARRTPGFHAPLIADIGTGSGAIAIALAKHLPQCRVIATDKCKAALLLARQNTDAYNVTDVIEFRHGDLLDPLQGQRVRYLVSNPPYISDDEWQDVPTNVKQYEPEQALRGGADGLRYLRSLIGRARRHLEQPGQLVVEIAAAQRISVTKLVEQTDGLSNPHVLADHEGLPRVLVADAE